MFWHQARAEFLKLFRVPAFSISSLLVPVVLFTFFGLPHVHERIEGVNAGTYLLASFGAYSVTIVMLYSFGVSISMERGQNIDALMRAAPLRPSVYLLARVLMVWAFALLALLVLSGFVVLVGGVRLGVWTWLNVIWRLLVGSIPFIGLGFAIGYLAGPNSAPAVINLITLPLVFASGLLLPLTNLPGWVQKVAPYLPTYRYAQLSWNAVGVKTDPLSINLLWLVGYSLVFFVVTLRAYRLEARRKFG